MSTHTHTKIEQYFARIIPIKLDLETSLKLQKSFKNLIKLKPMVKALRQFKVQKSFRVVKIFVTQFYVSLTLVERVGLDQLV